MKCYHHPSKDAVAQCRACGKSICKDCFDDYGVSTGEYADQALCYDCTAALVTENVNEISKFRSKVKRERILSLIGGVIGGIIGFPVLSSDMYGSFFWFLIIIGLFGSLSMLKGLISAVGAGSGFWLVVYLLGAPFIMVRNHIRRFNQIKQCSEIIASDEHALQEMRDYFAYTQEMEKQATNVDLAKLANEGGSLFNNTYAKAVLEKGKETAKAELRQSVVTISANGEIIRSFDKKPKKKAA